MEPSELKKLCSDSKMAWTAIGKIDYGLKSSESNNVKFRRPLYFVKDIKGEIITIDAVRSVRPGFGIAPKYLNEIIGKRVLNNVAKNSAVNFKDMKL